jgi:hypothetical protein
MFVQYLDDADINRMIRLWDCIRDAAPPSAKPGRAGGQTRPLEEQGA